MYSRMQSRANNTAHTVLVPDHARIHFFTGTISTHYFSARSLAYVYGSVCVCDRNSTFEVIFERSFLFLLL